MIYLTEDLVASVKRRTLAPTSQKTFQDADIIALLNEELELKIVPAILSVREDYFLNRAATNIAANVELYPIPERAIGNALKNIFYVLSDGISKMDLHRLQLADVVDYGQTASSPSGYILQGDYIRLLPQPNTTTGSLEVWHLQRPSQLVPTTSVCAITAVTSLAGTTTFTVDTDLTGTISVGDSVDFLNSDSPVMLSSRDVVVTAITVSSIAVATADVTDDSGAVSASIGDYVCAARHANIPMVPQEFHPLLAEMAAARIMQALGHNDKLQAVNVSIAEMKDAAMKMISTRVEDDPRAIVNRRGIFSFTSGANMARGRWRY